MTEPVLRERGRSGLGCMLSDTLGVAMVNQIGRHFWRAAAEGPLSVLIYHRVLPEPDPVIPDEITVKEFRHDMQLLADRFNVLSLHEGLRRLREGTLPPFAVCLTFDDGYRDNCTIALPVLQELGLSATFFVATAYLDGGRMWNDTLQACIRFWPRDTLDLSDWGVPVLPMASIADRRKTWTTLFRWMRRIGAQGRDEMLGRLVGQVDTALPTDLMMTSEHVKALAAAGMEVGCHTHSHPILTRIPDAEARKEISESRDTLQSLTQETVRYFAYPNGVPGDDFGPRHVDMVKECGFDAAFSTAWGAAKAGSDPFQLPRFTPWDKTSAGFMLRLLLNRRQDSYVRAI